MPPDATLCSIAVSNRSVTDIVDLWLHTQVRPDYLLERGP